MTRSARDRLSIKCMVQRHVELHQELVRSEARRQQGPFRQFMIVAVKIGVELLCHTR